MEVALGLDSPSIRRRKHRRVWTYAAALLSVATLICALWYWLAQPTTRLVYETVPATRSDLSVEVTATGTLQPLIQVDISSELSGVVRAVLVSENQQVAKGDVLAELDTTRLAAQVEGAVASAAAAKAQVSQAKTTLNESERALERTRELARRGTSTDQAVEAALAARDRAASAVAVAEANLQIAEAQLKLQQADLAKTRIYAPIDGVVLTRSVDPGQTVASSLQAPVLFVIAADLRRMELKAAIDEADIGMVASGQKAHFTVDAFPERVFEAEIRDLAYASVATEGVVTYDARLDVDNADLSLRPGMTATVSVVTRQAEGVITVPAAAFRFRPAAAETRRGWSLTNMFMPRMRRDGRRGEPRDVDGSRIVFVLENGKPKQARVRTGSSDGERTEIVSGLEPGDLVVVGSSEQPD